VIVRPPLPAEEEAKPFPSAGQSTPWPSVKLRAIIGVPLLVATTDFLVIRKWLFKVKTSRWRCPLTLSRKFQSLSPLVVIVVTDHLLLECLFPLWTFLLLSD